jgi:titin
MTNKEFYKALSIFTLGFCLFLLFSGAAYSEHEARVPRAPGGLYAVAQSSTSIDIHWSDNSRNEKGFKLYRSRGSGFSKIADIGSNTTSYHDADLKPGTTYYYKVSAYNDTGESSSSGEGYTTTFQERPAAPGYLNARAVSSSRIYLQWRNQAAGIDGFKIYRDSGGGYVKIDSVGRNSTSYNDDGLRPGTPYLYRVTAYNEAGESNYSNEAHAITLR